MKKILGSVLLVCLAAAACHAQESIAKYYGYNRGRYDNFDKYNNTGGVNLNAKVGMTLGIGYNISSFNYDEGAIVSENMYQGTKNKPGFNVGVNVRLHIPAAYTVFEFGMSYVGNYYSYSASGENGVNALTMDIKEGIIQFPVTVGLKYKFMRAYFGPTMNIWVSNEGAKRINSLLSVPAVIYREYNVFQVGYKAGIGFDPFRRFSVDLSYSGFFKGANNNTEITAFIKGGDDATNVLGGHFVTRMLNLNLTYFF